LWLKNNNTAYCDIIISEDRLSMLPENGELQDILTVEVDASKSKNADHGPAPNQTDPGDVNDAYSTSGTLLNDAPVDIRQQVEDIVKDVVGDNHGHVGINRRKHVTIPWPTRQNSPLSEFTTKNFFTLAFPSLFPNCQRGFSHQPSKNMPLPC
jgi:hypothetical protein